MEAVFSVIYMVHNVAGFFETFNNIRCIGIIVFNVQDSYAGILCLNIDCF
jgi:hypothetical protein